MKLTINDLRSRNLILLEALSGSHAYGLNVPSSDRDIRGVFILPQDDLYGMHHVDQVADEKNDVVFYELGRFIELLSKNNPTMLELLAVPEDCVLYRHSVMDLLKPETVLSMLCKETFAGYAKAQIFKARGLNKKVVNPMDKKRKGVLDFCFVVEGQGSICVVDWLGSHGWRQEDCGLVNIPHMHNVYALFHAEAEEARKIGLKGIVQKETANNISLSSIPKGMSPIATMSFNKDGYSIYCKDYKAYWDWVEKRNEVRFETNVKHGKNYDTKNMMHTFRLLQMAIEIADGKILVRRPNRDELLDIRFGNREYDDLLEEAGTYLSQIENVYANSKLPEKPDLETLNSVLVKMRKEVYG